ncbi:tRNA 4-thiouridine(8) synthase ThiI [Thermococcus chitonophagus]|uniref:Thiamine biosynthesis protein thiI-like n=1 Tax=Thermococcus chitonophagus TaxID=54262 RepID=A0A160VWN4_9EURY|nr:THUMP domain-containing protein [Thermococcus chitonophagus]ASJ16901.1 tRNA 4-thiouridine(8) synthase ThiI [Thermococcus chitonophagus]CUX78381.1 Thiamine biosynthesis protein thiI-like [Thermococcus chitonophagus]
MNTVIVRYGEIGTKSRQTRRWFERILINNIREALVSEDIEYKEVFSKHGRVIVRTNRAVEASSVLVRVFGIVSLSPAMEVEASLEKINKTALKLFRKKAKELSIKNPKFRVTARRITKEFPLNSLELQAKVGEYILENEECEVDLHNYDIEVGIEIMEGRAYIFTEKIRGWGGLPIGTQGKMVGILEDKKSALAIFLMMKRGVEVIPVYAGNENVKELWLRIKKFAYGSKGDLIRVESLGKVNKIIKDFGAKGVIKGLQLHEGTEEEIKKDKKMFTVPVYYPLIALPQDYIEDVAKRIPL